jgi:hypothetical protein
MEPRSQPRTKKPTETLPGPGTLEGELVRATIVEERPRAGRGESKKPTAGSLPISPVRLASPHPVVIGGEIEVHFGVRGINGFGPVLVVGRSASGARCSGGRRRPAGPSVPLPGGIPEVEVTKDALDDEFLLGVGEGGDDAQALSAGGADLGIDQPGLCDESSPAAPPFPLERAFRLLRRLAVRRGEWGGRWRRRRRGDGGGLRLQGREW